MKVLLTGTTGFIGGAVLKRCLSLPSISEVVVLTRRELTTKHAKLTAIIHKDFSTYSDSLMQRLEDVDAVIWSLGNPRSESNVHLDYTVRALTALLRNRSRPLQLVYVSGAVAERDQDKSLWIASSMRKLRGEVENQLLDLQEAKSAILRVSIARPALVTEGTPFWAVIAPGYTIPVSLLAAALVNLTGGTSGNNILSNAELRTLGGRK